MLIGPERIEHTRCLDSQLTTSQPHQPAAILQIAQGQQQEVVALSLAASPREARSAMAMISAATATATAVFAGTTRPSHALGLSQLRVRAEKLQCSYSKDGKEAAAVNGASLLAAASATAMTAAAPALALVDERMSTEGTGLSLGLSNNLLGWILLGVFGLIWSLYTVYSSTLDDDDESGGLSL